MLSDPLALESIVALASELIRVPSVNPAIAPDEAHGEHAVASFACEWLAARGVKAWLEEAAPGRPEGARFSPSASPRRADGGAGVTSTRRGLATLVICALPRGAQEAQRSTLR